MAMTAKLILLILLILISFGCATPEIPIEKISGPAAEDVQQKETDSVQEPSPQRVR